MRDIAYRLWVLRNGAIYGRLSWPASSPPVIDFDSTAEIKSSMSVELASDSGIDLLRDELQPCIIVDGVETPLGVFRAASAPFSGSGSVSRKKLEAYDRCWRLKEDKLESRLYIAAGTAYLAAVELQLAAVGYGLAVKSECAATLPCDHEYDAGTDRLSIVNQLLTEINFNELWFDTSGFPHLEAYAAPSADNIKHRYGPRELMRLTPDYSGDTDIFDAPNVFICVCASGDRDTILTATSVNDAPMSAKSTFRRGMRIASVVKVSQIADQTALQAYADRLKTESQLTESAVEFHTLAEGGHGLGDVLAVDHPELGGIYTETGWSLTMAAGEPMRHKAQRTVL